MSCPSRAIRAHVAARSPAPAHGQRRPMGPRIERGQSTGRSGARPADHPDAERERPSQRTSWNARGRPSWTPCRALRRRLDLLVVVAAAARPTTALLARAGIQSSKLLQMIAAASGQVYFAPMGIGSALPTRCTAPLCTSERATRAGRGASSARFSQRRRRGAGTPPRSGRLDAGRGARPCLDERGAKRGARGAPGQSLPSLPTSPLTARHWLRQVWRSGQ